jgi:hypothetical protein
MCFEKDGKWGIRDSNTTIISPRFDTIFGFDPLKKVCLGCFELKRNASNKYMRVTSIAFACNYLNPNNERLVIKDGLGDTCSVFSLGKQSVAQYSTVAEVMCVSVKGVRNLVTKDFRQLTFRGYHNILPSPVPGFYLCEYQSESETVFSGLIDKEEDEVIPYKYTSIKFNTRDSLIVCCSAGLLNGTDDIYDYEGHRLVSSNKHIEQVSRRYAVEKTFDPSGQYYLLNRLTGEDKLIEADELALSDHDEILLRKKNTWFTYDAETGTKKQIKQP